MKYWLRFSATITLTLFAVCGCATTSSNSSEDVGWITLFDGSSLDGWRGYNGDRVPPGWRILDGELTYEKVRDAKDSDNYKGSRDLIYAAREFEDFELYLEWKISPGGNSGIFYHAVEGYKRIYQVAPEYQLIDDEGFSRHHKTELEPAQTTGANYGMHVPDASKKRLHPIGEWNSSRIVFTSDRVEHWLNGELLLHFVPWSEDWKLRKSEGKWNLAADYGKYKKGYIGLQDHGSPIWFRNIKVRPL